MKPLILIVLLFLNLIAAAQTSKSIENKVVEYKQQPEEQNLNIPKIQILTDKLFEGIVTENRSESDIIDDKIVKIENIKNDPNEKLNEQTVELQRIEQLDRLKVQLLEQKEKSIKSKAQTK